MLSIQDGQIRYVIFDFLSPLDSISTKVSDGVAKLFLTGKTSKRKPTRLRHKIEKAAASKRRKDKKLAKKVNFHEKNFFL